MDYTAVGDCTHLAARLQQSAAPGTIVVSQSTARLIDNHVALEPLGALAVRGLSGPVTAYRLTGAIAAGGGQPRARSRFVGREREAATLRELVTEVGQGHGRVAGIVGEPGVGKSRLLVEVRRDVGEGATWLEGRCLSYGSTIPYLPVLDLLRAACGIAHVDPPERAADKIRATRDSLGLDPVERAPLLLHLLGLKDTDEAVHALAANVLAARALDTLRQVWLRSSRPRPLVLLVDDEPGVEPHAHAERDRRAGVQHDGLLERPGDAESSQRRPARVVLVRERRAEEGHEAVAEKLVDGALVAVDLGEGDLEEPVEEIVHRVGPQPLGQRGGADQIAEEHGDRLALALQRRPRGEDALGEVPGCVGVGGTAGRGGRRRGVERAPALGTEPRAGRQLGAARRAGGGQPPAARDAEPRARGIVLMTGSALHVRQVSAPAPVKLRWSGEPVSGRTRARGWLPGAWLRGQRRPRGARPPAFRRLPLPGGVRPAA
jgi:AAA ATPase-like protein